MAEAKKQRADARDITVLVGVTLLTVGGWFIAGPAALVLPGAILTWAALPPRPPFVSK